MAVLESASGCDARGMELDGALVERCVSRGLSVVQGDANLDRLTRVYGTAFSTQAELDEFLKQKEEAVKRDHRIIGKHLHLFHIGIKVDEELFFLGFHGLQGQIDDFFNLPGPVSHSVLQVSAYFEIVFLN